MTGEDVAEEENIIVLSPISILEEENNKSRGASVELIQLIFLTF